MLELLLILRPLGEGRYAAVLPCGTELCRSRSPFFAAARLVPPATLLAARHEGSSIVAMRGLAAELASWTVTESDAAGLRRAPFRAMPDDMRGQRPPAHEDVALASAVIG